MAETYSVPLSRVVSQFDLQIAWKSTDYDKIQITVADVAQALGKGESTVKQLFSLYRDKGIIKYYNGLKIKEAKRLIREGIDEETFLRMKRSTLGRRIRDLDSFDSTCFRVCAYQLDGFDYFRFPELFAAVTEEEVRQFIRDAVKAEHCSICIIEPDEES